MWALLPLLALPLVKGIATFPNVDICIGPGGQQVSCSDFDSDENNSTTVEWDCDIRAWTRAPDLIPGHSISAETRLSMNGSACSEVAGWEIGLRMKERSIIKIRKHDVEFPKRPERKPYNHTMVQIEDMNDIYRGRYGNYYGHSGQDLEYEDALEVYNEAIRNKSLFQVDGRERVLFDSRLTMDLPTYKGENPVNHIRGFSIDVPLTNFPPIKAYEGHMGSSGKDEQMLNTETMFEYYHLLTLSNGTILDIPAGRAGFLTEPHPISTAPEEKMDWPIVVSFDSPRKGNDTQSDEGDIFGMSRYNQGPICDAGNKAEFEMTISSPSEVISSDKNITLSIHLARKGNGSEYPAFLDFSLTTFQNQTFAYTYPQINSKLDYNNLIREDDNYRPGGVDTSYPQTMLMVQSQESLERRRREMEITHMVTMSGSGGRWPVQRGEVRYDFEEVYGDEVKEEYEFEIEFPIPYNAYPNFETVFSTFTPQLSFSLQTTFVCSRTKPVAGEGENKVIDESKVLDDEWEEWQLPTKKPPYSDPFNSHGMNHRGYTPIIIHRRSNLPANQQIKMKHYLDPTAYAPVLSSKTIPKISPNAKSRVLVRQQIREEEESELKQSRYDLYSSGRQYQPRCVATRFGGDPACWNMNNGGGGKHAAKLWQRMEEEARVSAAVDDTIPVRGAEEQIVYQVPVA